MKDILKNKEVRYLFIGIILITVIIGGFLIVNGNSEPGVYREFSKKEISPGETFTLKLNAIVEGDERYYLIEETVPEEFQIIDNESDDNKIKLFAIESPLESKEYKYELRAPKKEGEYQFEGEYALDGYDGPLEINGKNKIVVKD